MSVTKPPAPTTPAAALRVVIAEDAVLLREGLGRLLTEAGLEVAGAAGDATELLRLVESLRPDVVLADIRMPPERRQPKASRQRLRSASNGPARP